MEQQVFLGKSSIKALFPVLQQYNSKQIFFVRGKKSYEICGAKDIMDNVFEYFHCEVTEFSDFEENPKIEDLKKGLTLLQQCSAKIIIAIGGGSVLDMAKLIRFFYSFSGDPTGNTFIKESELLPLITLPTTSGTGCETTHFAVLYKNKEKYSVAHDTILPDIAIIYPPFTYQNSKYLTACTGFDALAQGIEAYWNVNATEESNNYAKKAIQLLWSNLPIAVNSPNEEARNKISEGSYWAGKAINITKTTAPHALSYPFTSYYNIPHGHAVALSFPFVAGLNFDVSEKNVHPSISLSEIRVRLKVLSNILNINNQTDSVLSVVYNYIVKLGLSFELPKNYNRENVMNHINIQRIANNPRIFTHEDLNSIFEQIEQINLKKLSH